MTLPRLSENVQFAVSRFTHHRSLAPHIAKRTTAAIAPAHFTVARMSVCGATPARQVFAIVPVTRAVPHSGQTAVDARPASK